MARHAGLRFIDRPFPSLQQALAAVCTGDADVILVQGGADDHHPPCAMQASYRGFPGAGTALAGPRTKRLPRDVDGLPTVALAAVEGGAYPGWLAQYAGPVQVLPVPNVYAALAAVEAGAADAAIGMDASLRPIVRRHFSGSLKMQAIRSGFPDQLHLLARNDDRPLLAKIEQALDSISLEEHAGLAQRWAVQTLPSSLADALEQIGARAAPWLLPFAFLALAAMVLRRHVWRLWRGRSRSHAYVVGMISHEVRNSAQLVLSSLDLLRQLNLPGTARELVASANRASLDLRTRLTRTLDFSRLATGHFTPTAAPCNVVAVCEEALQAIDHAARSKGLRLQLHVDPAPLPGLLLDPHCLRQLLDNLLGNALKFTDAGGIDVRVTLEGGTRPEHLLLHVIDSGIGIAPTQMKVLFQPFQPGDEGRARGGSGLGLSICRELARSMGGELGVHSVHGRGSRFSLRLPATAVALPPGPGTPCAAAPVEPVLAGVDILLVEDHAMARRALAAQLRQRGATVHEASSADAALLHQRAFPHAVVLLDIELGQSSGYRLAPQLRTAAGPQGADLRIIALSAHAGPAHQRRCRRAGFDAVLGKPLRMDALLQALGHSASEAGGTLQLQAGWQEALQQDLRHEYEAVDQALGERDATALAHHAHRMHGVLQMQGRLVLAEAAADLATLARAGVPDWHAARQLAAQLQAGHDPGTSGAVQAP
ncbi:ATP-binding protein [Stenotrophomonas sp. ZAC14D2_NAIMI4_7]|uniref:ATP-binding protein n=1 Tax=Stenotrophomonas sp. ZAC14D2_NAIMI4_7 TaxID=2072405 RepID=UPI001F1C3A2C|nr:ATP-binding protein [Stenotrophomonas sp. ZAC14D2_NAIMI4_7]